MEIKWLGHSALMLIGSKIVLIDPFLTGNPKAAVTAESIKKCDMVVVTHDHGDHIGDAYDICKRTGAVFVSFFEIALVAEEKGITAEQMSVGGTIENSGIKVSMVPAFHSGGLGGTAVGVVVEMDGKKVYHAGDTGVSMEMQLTGELYEPDIAFLPIDGRFNMTPRLAAKAVELLKVPKAVPIHYDTFPVIISSPGEFKKFVGNMSEIIIMNPGDKIEL